MNDFEIKLILIVMFFIIFISIQYTLNKILATLKEIKSILIYKENKKE